MPHTPSSLATTNQQHEWNTFGLLNSGTIGQPEVYIILAWGQFHTDFYSCVNHKNWFDFPVTVGSQKLGRADREAADRGGGVLLEKLLIWIILLIINSLRLPKTILSSTMNSSLPQSITYVWARAAESYYIQQSNTSDTLITYSIPSSTMASSSFQCWIILCF